MKRFILVLFATACLGSTLNASGPAGDSYRGKEKYRGEDDGDDTVTISVEEYQSLKRQAKRKHRHAWTDYVPYGPGYALRLPYPVVVPPPLYLPSPLEAVRVLNAVGGKAAPAIVAAGLIGGIVSIALVNQHNQNQEVKKRAEKRLRIAETNAAIIQAAKTPKHEITREELAREYEALHPEMDPRSKFKKAN